MASDEPKWHGDHQEWKRNIRSLQSLSETARPYFEPVSARAQAVAVAVFHAAGDYNSLYWSPLPEQLNAWAAIFDCNERDCRDWLTVELADRAVREHFSESIDGRIMPAHVLQRVAVLHLEGLANGA